MAPLNYCLPLTKEGKNRLNSLASLLEVKRPFLIQWLLAHPGTFDGAYRPETQLHLTIELPGRPIDNGAKIDGILRELPVGNYRKADFLTFYLPFAWLQKRVVQACLAHEDLVGHLTRSVEALLYPVPKNEMCRVVLPVSEKIYRAFEESCEEMGLNVDSVLWERCGKP